MVVVSAETMAQTTSIAATGAGRWLLVAVLSAHLQIFCIAGTGSNEQRPQALHEFLVGSSGQRALPDQLRARQLLPAGVAPGIGLTCPVGQHLVILVDTAGMEGPMHIQRLNSTKGFLQSLLLRLASDPLRVGIIQTDDSSNHDVISAIEGNRAAVIG